MTDQPDKEPRSYRCSCGARVSMPLGSRRFTLDDIRRVHNDTCPARNRK